MIKNRSAPGSGSRICLSAFILTVGLTAACMPVLSPVPPIISRPLHISAEMQMLKKGYEAFQQGDLKTAEEIFGYLHQQTENMKISRQSLYGLSCTRLIQAQDPDDFSEAIRLWEAWSRLRPDNLSGEDPRMLDSLLRESAASGTAESREPENEPQNEAPEEPPSAANEIEAPENDPPETVKKRPDRSAFYKKIIKTREKEIQRLNYRLEKMKKENRTLKHQIEALETIHLNIQEKKKEISSP